MLGSGQDFSVDSSTSAAGRADEAEVEPQSAISSAIAPTAESAATTQEDDTEEKDPMDLMSQPTSLFERRAEKPMRKPAVLQQPQAAAPSPAALINYRGVNISMACQEGNLAACVLLWGIAAAKRITLMDADAEGNNPMHFACMADNPEVRNLLCHCFFKYSKLNNVCLFPFLGDRLSDSADPRNARCDHATDGQPQQDRRDAPHALDGQLCAHRREGTPRT